MADTTKPIRALIIAPQWIGDAVMTEPLLRQLAARGMRLTVGAVPWVAPVYRVMPGVAEVIELPFRHGGLQLKSRWTLARALRGRFDVAYVCPNSLKSALLPWLARIPERLGYTGEKRYGLLTQRLDSPSKSERPPMVAFYAALGQLGPGGQRTQLEDAGRPTLTAASPLLAQALDALAGHANLPALARDSFVVFAPGAEFGPAKRWPAQHFAELALKLDQPVLLLGSNKERALCDEIATSVNAKRPGQCHNLAGTTQLLQAFALIAHAHRVVSNDSGLMHVAAAFGVPQVAVFGSSSPDHTPPLNDKAQVIWLRRDAAYQPPLDCSPCYQRVCPLGHTRCLNDVSAERVYQLM